MFALEIKFKDGVSQSETILIRRPQAILGSSDFAHVVIEDMKNLNYQLRIAKGIGRSFSCQPIGVALKSGSIFEGVYEGNATLDLGTIELLLSSLDTDLLVKEGEPPDRAGVRVLRQSCAHHTPAFPALTVLGPSPVTISFPPDQAVQVGRSKKCVLRLDAADVSSEHARIGFESGQFWVEDLGSTNGTFVNKQQVSGRQSVPAGIPIVLGRELAIMGVTSESQLQVQPPKGTDIAPSGVESRYPVLLTLSELVRPARVALRPGSSVALGRDPASDMWVGAPHISRRHAVFEMTKTGNLSLTDCSTNGIALDGKRLERNVPVSVDGDGVVDFGGGITVGVCFSKENEQKFVSAKGGASSFGAPAAPSLDALRPRKHSTQWKEVGLAAASAELFPQEEKPSIWLEWLSPMHARGTKRKLIACVVVLGAVVLLAALGDLIYGLFS